MTSNYLSNEQRLSQLDTYSLLSSVYCLEGEFVAGEDTPSTVELLSQSADATLLGSTLSFTINITLNTAHILELGISLPLKKDLTGDDKNDWNPNIHLKCPSWMNRKAHADLVAKLKVKEAEGGSEIEDSGATIMAIVDFIRENGPHYLPTTKEDTAKKPEEFNKHGKVVRIWFYFPSLSTKEKRKDLVDYAASYHLTGFVVAGKPGVLCLEGPTATHVSDYMSEIKNVSWADIPANNKKVSEMYREDGVERAFVDMQEVTEQVFQAGMRGTRGNRGDLKELRGFLDNYGLGDRLEKVLGANWD